MDIVIRGGTVVDGTGSAGFVADVGIEASRIAAIGDRLTAARTIDASGLVLAPGFIDMHAHSDLQILANPDHLAKISQGVTLEVVGQDGLSYAPVDDATLDNLRTQLAGWNDDPDGFDWNWRGVGEYLDRLDRGVTTNIAYLLPQGTIRMLVLGWDARAATDSEMDRMRAVVATGMAEGAVGLSSGLTYTPGMYASTAELVALCQVVGQLGGYYSPHHRSYGAGALEAYAEMVEVSRRSGCPLHLAHATLNYPVNAGRSGELLSLLDKAIAAGCDISLDTYPYLPSSTYLFALLPSWSTEGGLDATVTRLSDQDTRARIRIDLERNGSDGCNGVPVDWAWVEINGVRLPENAELVGRTVAEAARLAGRQATEFYLDTLIADRLGSTCVMHVGNEDNVRAIMRHPAHTGGSDGLLAGTRPHPRAWGTFPRYLARYVRELGVLGLEDCVAHLTGRAARRLRLSDRGLIREGYAADLVLFDPDTVTDRATFEDPKRPADGIPYVLVNGTPVIDDGRHTGALAGHSIRGSAWTS